MTDCFTRKTRSKVMRAVRSQGNLSTELKLARLFRERSLVGWRRRSDLIGNPDFIFPKKRIAIFADGCFWHGHSCRILSPQSNVDFWKLKIKRNKIRDRKVNKQLRNRGWAVIRIWECEIGEKKLDRRLALIRKRSPRGIIITSVKSA